MFRNFNASPLGTMLQQSEIIELALSYGFKAIDLDIVEFTSLARLKGIPYARRLIDSAQIGVGTFRLPIDWDATDEEYKKALERLAEHCQNAVALGCKRCYSVLAPFSETRPMQENFELHRQRLLEVCSVLKSYGVQLGLGFKARFNSPREGVFQFIQKLEELLPLIEAVKADNLGLLADVWDIFLAQGDLNLLYAQPKEMIVAVRLADLPPEVEVTEVQEGDRYLARPGGRIDCVAVLKWLAEMGYEGPVTPFPSRKALGTGRAETAAREIGIATLAIWQAAGLPIEPRYASLARAGFQPMSG